MKQHIGSRAIFRMLRQMTLMVMLAGIFCQPGEAETGPDTLRLRMWQAPTSLVPHLSGAYKDITATMVVYEPLAYFDTEGRLIPYLAEDIPSLENGGVASDGKSVIWKLKPDVKWADGQPFTAHDVRFTYEFISNPELKAISSNNYKSVKAVQVLDDLTVKVIFHECNPAWAIPFVGHNGLILPRHLFAPCNNATIHKKPRAFFAIGTGPYRLVKYKKEDMLLIGEDLVNMVKIMYDANPYFREKGKPHFKHMEIQGGGDHLIAAQSLFIDGTVDFVWDFHLETEKMKEMETLGKGSALSASSAFMERLLLNRADPNRATETGERAHRAFPHPFFRDKTVRQAFAHAVDRKGIAEIYGKTGRITTNILTSPSMYNSPNTAHLYPFDLKRAAALLDQAGWVDSDGDGIRDKDRVKMTVTYQTSVNSIRQQVQHLMKENLESIGVEVVIKMIDGGVFFNREPENTRNFIHFYADMEQYSIGPPSPDPLSYMSWWTCAQIPEDANKWNGYNQARFCNPEYEALFSQVKTEMNPVKRRDLFIRMNDLLIEDVAVIPLILRQIFVGVSNSLEGVETNQWELSTWKIKDWRRKK